MTQGAGRLIVLTAPSGAGKTSLCRELVDQVEDLRYSVSYTTRPTRGGERDGIDYNFVTRETFQGMIEKGRFGEWAEIHGNLYGTSLDDLERAREEKIDLLLEIEGKGAGQIRKRWPDSILIFLTVSDFDELRSRLYSRASDSREEIERRISHVQSEIAYMPSYDYIVINDDFDVALFKLISIVFAERSRRDAILPTLPWTLKALE